MKKRTTEYRRGQTPKKERGTIVKAEGPVLLFPKSPVSASLLSYLIDMKYNKGVLLYRIEQSLKLEGILFPRHTYASWMIQASDQYLIKVNEYMHQTIIYADETYHDLFRDGRENSKLKRTLYLDVSNRYHSRESHCIVCAQRW